MSVTMDVKLRGPMFEGKISSKVERAILEEGVEKIGQRMERGGRGLGAKRNTITRRVRGRMESEARSTRRAPRTKGTAWLRKNEQVGKAMAPRVLRAVAKRIVSEI